jgi:ferredoxin/flavodoxin---NADP+ reductase
MSTSERFYRATVTARKEHTSDLWTVHLSLPGPFAYKPGQYATLGVERDGKPVERPYSIVSAPHESHLEFFFDLVPNGELTPFLYRLQPGDSLSVRKAAKGLFTLDTRSGHKNHFLISTVTGVAPFVSYIRSLRHDSAQLSPDTRLWLLQGASRSVELGYAEELRKAAAELPWVTYVPTISRPWEEPEWTGETGRVDDLIRKYAAQWQLSPGDTTAYLCGNPQMVENSKGILGRAGFAKESIKEEVFWVPQGSAAESAGPD